MWKAGSVILFAALASAAASAAFAFTNGLDARFGSGGVVLLGPTPTSGLISRGIFGMAVQPDGKIVIATRVFNDTDPGMGATLPAIGRLNADASWDASFADHGLYVLPFGATAAPDGGEVHEIVLLSDNSIAAAGGSFVTTFSHDFHTCTLLMRLDSSGSPVSTFGPGDNGSFCFDFAPDLTNDYWFRHFEGFAADSDDSLFVTTVRTNLGYGAVAQFDANGALVSGYGSDGIAALPAGVPTGLLKVRPDHKLMVVGIRVLSIFPADWTIATVRLGSTGEVDSQYGTQGEFDLPVPNTGVMSPLSAVLKDGRLLVASYNDSQPFSFYSLDESGAADAGFNDAGQQPGFPGVAQLPLPLDVSDDGILAAQPLPDAHIFAVGNVGTNPINLALIRLNADSSYDANYGDSQHPGWVTVNVGGLTTSNTHADALAVDAAGHAVVAFVTADDGIGKNCTGLIRVITDRLFDGAFDAPPAMPICPQ